MEDIRDQIVALLPRLRRFAYLLAKDQDRADDLVQEACIRALSHADRWEPGTRLDSWMYRITQNVWLDQVRASKVRGTSVDVDEALHLVGADGRDVTESRMTLDQVSRHIAELTEEQQILITLVCVDGLSYKETAEALGIPIGTVMSRLARARRALFAAAHGEDPISAASQREKRDGRGIG
ncbi:MAG: RNA polymerase sigma factor [Pseudomonadota bacterium]